MHPEQFKPWIDLTSTLVDIVKGLITIGATILGGLWAWSRFVLERGLMPPSQMDLTLRTVGYEESATLVEIEVQIANKGSSALIVTDLRLRLRYIDESDEIRLLNDPTKDSFGHLLFPHASVLQGIAGEKRPIKETSRDSEKSLGSGEFLVVPYDTFVQPEVSQAYTFATALPRTASYLLARASFRYQVRPSETQLSILRVSRRLGMLQYSLNHVKVPHTVERFFKIADANSAIAPK